MLTTLGVMLQGCRCGRVVTHSGLLGYIEYIDRVHTFYQFNQGMSTSLFLNKFDSGSLNKLDPTT